MGAYVYTNYSRGWVVEEVRGDYRCSSWLLLPAENLWSEALRTTLYIIALLYLFLGIAIVSDVFMCSIEVITSQRRTVVRWDAHTGTSTLHSVLVWNETVANLTLMALGSSAPEILLAVIETLSSLDTDTMTENDGLGVFTIIGSAAFNLLVITAICIVSVPTPQVKVVRELGVFALTSIFSILAYVWMLLVLRVISPGEIEVWEAWLTFLFFPLMVGTAYAQDRGWWRQRSRINAHDEQNAATNVRVLLDHRKVIGNVPAKELSVLEKERRNSRDPTAVIVPERAIRTRFRHLAVGAMTGARLRHDVLPKIPAVRFAEAVAMMQQKSVEKGKSATPKSDMYRKFTFAMESYSVMENAGYIQIEVVFHRRAVNGVDARKVNDSSTDVVDVDGRDFEGTVSVEFETREGSARIGKDFEYTQGLLTFEGVATSQTVRVPIINDVQYTQNVDFYVILKNPTDKMAALGDPSISRVTIIDDDQPGEIQFEKSHFYVGAKSGTLVAKIIRENGSDGDISVDYKTIDGTAVGGTAEGGKLEAVGGGPADFLHSEGTLSFKHQETSQQLVIPINRDTSEPKNFIITLRNASFGAKIGCHCAALISINHDSISERLAEVINEEDSDEGTWGGQFKSALSIFPERGDNGKPLPVSIVKGFLHFLTFFWKVLFAFIPPRSYWGAWPAFFCSLLGIAVLTAAVEQLGKLLSCVIGLRLSVAGITVIAIGTSLPDTFASRTAALHDTHADAAIGNITGSNSVNVFLGLGLPWVVKSMYLLTQKRKFRVNTDNLVQAVLFFIVVGTISLLVLVLRRCTVGGELGGKRKLPKYVSSIFLFGLWIVYIFVSSLRAYHPELIPF